MKDKLGITVTRIGQMRHVLGLARAARANGGETDVFFTGDGVHNTRDERFSELIDVASVGVCEASYLARGYNGKHTLGLADKDFVTQARNAEMVDKCDRYLVL